MIGFPYDLPIQLQTAPPDAVGREAEERSPPLPTVMLPTFPRRSSYSYTVTLAGTTYGVELRRNRRDGHWYLSLRLDGEPLRLGVRLIEGWPAPLGADPRLPPGSIVPLRDGAIAYVEEAS